MTYSIILSEIAEREIAAIRDWYDAQPFQYGLDFILTIEDTFARIAYNPNIYPVVLFNKYRRVLVRRFPYAVYFSVEGNVIKISSVFHHSRSPEILYKKLH
jgi:plasmid stabilization system protein ParE